MADNLVVVRGDTPQIRIGPVTREDVNGVDQDVDLTGASATLTVRRNLNSTTTEFTKTATFDVGNALILVDLLAANTSGMSPGLYIYDVQLTEASGRITTFPAKGYGKFKLVADVTHA